MRRRTTRTLLLSLVLALAVVGSLPVAAMAQPVPLAIHIPVIVNLYPNSLTTEPEARDAIAEANKILAQASMTLRVVRVNSPPGAGNGDNGNGEFTSAEREAIRTFGGQELNKLKNRKGIKISFGRTPKVGSTTPGVSVHKDPTIIVKERDTVGNTGQTIAHEIGHVLTLSGGHKIEDKNKDGDWSDPGESADAGGHTPDQPGDTGNGNIMAPSNRRVGTNLTKDQIDEMRSRRYVHGKCTSQWEKYYPAVKDKQQFGGGTDEHEDQGTASEIYDIHQVFLTSVDGGADIDAQITLAGVLPGTGTIDGEYALGFDADASTSTGVMFAGQSGIDRIVHVRLIGDIGIGTFAVSGEVEDTVLGTTVSLPQTPLAETDAELYDLDESAASIATSLLFSIPKAMLGLSAVQVPVLASAGTDVSIYDTADLYFNQQQWLDDPTLETFGTGVPIAGENYRFAVSGLEPYDTFNLYVDDRLVLTDTLDASGGYSGEFLFPSYLRNDQMHFLTAQDSTGEFAYSMTCPEPHHTDPTEDTPYTFVESSSDTAVPSKGYSNDPFPSGPWKMGASAWRYKDSWDAAAKYEGSYREFDTYAAGGKYLLNPHGGYATGSNKCKTCHAVHRANGGFKLMRVDDPNEACTYCHVSGSQHSNKRVYFGGDSTIYPENGHTIGSGKSIPDSSTWQWLEAKTLTGGDTGEFSATVNVRRYNSAKNKIMVWSTERASYHISGSSATVPLRRWGPTLLTCMSCHQPHNADKLIWKPDAANGYKLLRASPSGSIIVPGPGSEYNTRFFMETYSQWSINYPDAMARAVQDTLSADNTGMQNALGSPNWPNTASGNVGKTIYTQFKGGTVDVNEYVGTTMVPRLTVWCADCHNLNIGYYEQIGEPNFRGEETGQYHSDRTHSAGGRIDCVNCHSTNWSTQSSNWTTAVGSVAVSCSKCHWYNNGAAFYNATNAASDFPHSGATQSTKLLDDAYDASTEHLDFICTRCHDLIGVSM